MSKKSSPAPDYKPMQQASDRAAQLGYDMGQQQLAEGRRQYDQSFAAMQPLIQSQIRIQDQAYQQGIEDNARRKSVFQPLEDDIVADAKAFNQEGAKERYASSAVSDIGQGYANARAGLQNSLASRGVNPNSGASLAAERGMAFSQAKDMAGAYTNARQMAEKEGLARKYAAAALGNPLAQGSLAAYGVSSGAGNSAQSGVLSGRYDWMSPGVGTMQRGQSMQMQGLGNVLNSQTQLRQAGMNATGEMWGSILGAGATLGGAAIGKWSDRRLKEDVVLVGKDVKTGLNVYEFKYRGDDKRFRGVMADEVETKFPDAVVYSSNGYARVNYDMLGLQMVEV